MLIDDHFDARLAKAEADTKALGFVSIVELAAELGVSVRTIRRLQAAGRMPPRVKRGRRKVYRRADLDQLFSKTETKSK